MSRTRGQGAGQRRVDLIVGLDDEVDAGGARPGSDAVRAVGAEHDAAVVAPGELGVMYDLRVGVVVHHEALGEAERGQELDRSAGVGVAEAGIQLWSGHVRDSFPERIGSD